MTGTEKLARYSRNDKTRHKLTASPGPESVSDKTPYEPYRLSKIQRHFLEIRTKFPEPAEAQSYAMLTSMTGEWRMGLSVALSYGNFLMVKVRGEKLTELFRALQEWRVEFIQEYDPEMHEPPTDPNAPFIKSIELLWERPAPPPPMNQRH